MLFLKEKCWVLDDGLLRDKFCFVSEDEGVFFEEFCCRSLSNWFILAYICMALNKVD
jgi:hypothetical protein